MKKILFVLLVIALLIIPVATAPVTKSYEAKKAEPVKEPEKFAIAYVNTIEWQNPGAIKEGFTFSSETKEIKIAFKGLGNERALSVFTALQGSTEGCTILVSRDQSWWDKAKNTASDFFSSLWAKISDYDLEGAWQEIKKTIWNSENIEYFTFSECSYYEKSDAKKENPKKLNIKALASAKTPIYFVLTPLKADSMVVEEQKTAEVFFKQAETKPEPEPDKQPDVPPKQEPKKNVEISKSIINALASLAKNMFNELFE